MLDPIHERIVRDYLQAKDENRPHLMARAFAADARFEPHFAFDNPAGEHPSEGLPAITDVFRALSQQCENIYTLCTTDSVQSEGGTMTCRWLVTMTDRESHAVRLAWGDYRWDIDMEAGLARELVVNMVGSTELPPDALGAVMGWMSVIPAPWCSTGELLEGMPRRDALREVSAYFRKGTGQ